MKRILILWLAALCLLASTAVSEGDAASLGERATLEALIAANELDAALGVASGIALNTIYYGDEGEETVSYYTFAGRDAEGGLRYAYEDSEGNVSIISGGTRVGYDAWVGRKFVTAYWPGEYEVDLAMAVTEFLLPLADEWTISDVRQSGDCVYATAQWPYVEDGGMAVMELTLDAETLLLREYTEYYADAQGAKVKSAYAFVTKNVEYKEDPAFTALRAPDETRTVKVIYNPGEADEQACEYALPRGVFAQLYCPEDCLLFEDRALTVFYTDAEPDENGNYPEYTEVYMGPVA